MLGDLSQYSTNTLYNMVTQISNEINRRQDGNIPKDLCCDVCNHEILGDKYQFDENTFACDICYEINEQVKKDVAQWNEWQKEWANK